MLKWVQNEPRNISYLYNKDVQLIPGSYETVYNTHLIINESLKNIYPNKDDREQFISAMKLSGIEPIPESEFEWVKKNDRACY